MSQQEALAHYATTYLVSNAFWNHQVPDLSDEGFRLLSHPRLAVYDQSGGAPVKGERAWQAPAGLKTPALAILEVGVVVAVDAAGLSRGELLTSSMARDFANHFVARFASDLIADAQAFAKIRGGRSDAAKTRAKQKRNRIGLSIATKLRACQTAYAAARKYAQETGLSLHSSPTFTEHSTLYDSQSDSGQTDSETCKTRNQTEESGYESAETVRA